MINNHISLPEDWEAFEICSNQINFVILQTRDKVVCKTIAHQINMKLIGPNRHCGACSINYFKINYLPIFLPEQQNYNFLHFYALPHMNMKTNTRNRRALSGTTTLYKSVKNNRTVMNKILINSSIFKTNTRLKSSLHNTKCN